MPFTLAAIAATAVPIMPTPMPMAATELAIAAPPADPPAVAWAADSTFFCAAACLSPRNFLTDAAMPSPSFRHGDQNASASDTWLSTTLVTTASQSLPSRS